VAVSDETGRSRIKRIKNAYLGDKLKKVHSINE
jgi:hypothetical protein